jgi:cytochrome c peroxidase
MRRPPKTVKTAKRVTKSVRLTEAEAEELAQLVADTAYAEAALLRQWVLSGMQHFRLTEAIRAYQDGRLNIDQAAQQANLPVAVLLEEMAARKVAVIDASEAFGAGLTALREAFGQEAKVESDTSS